MSIDDGTWLEFPVGSPLFQTTNVWYFEVLQCVDIRRQSRLFAWGLTQGRKTALSLNLVWSTGSIPIFDGFNMF